MDVTILDATQNPIDIISIAAGTSTRKDDVRFRRVKHCVELDHSVSEFADITFKIEGVSRTCMAQATRHRHASWCVESGRYNKYDLSGDDWYVIPPSIEALGEGAVRGYKNHMRACATQYKAYMSDGIKAEDARFMLPESMKTTMTCKMNVRSLFHFLNMRSHKNAQWEIREVCMLLKRRIREYNEQWAQIMDIYEMTQEPKE